MKKLLTLLALGMFSVLSYAQTDTVSVESQLQKLEKTDQVLSKILEKSLVVAEKTGDFVVEQAPDLLREFYLWHVLESFFWMFVGFAILYGIYLLVMACGEKKKKYSCDVKILGRYFSDEEKVGVYLVLIMGLAMGASFILSNIMDLFRIWLTPKLYLIEYLLSIRNK